MTSSRALTPSPVPVRPVPAAPGAFPVGWLTAGVRDLVASDTVDDEESRRLYASLAAVPVQVAQAVRDGLPAAQAAEAVDTAAMAGVLQCALRDHVRTTSSERFARVQRVLEGLGRAADPLELTARCAEAAATAGGFDRALLSRVEGSTWCPGTLHVAGQDPARVVEAGCELPLAAGRAETEAVRRRVPVLSVVASGDTGHPLGSAGTRTPYVVAPVTVDGRVIGLLHADNARTGRAVTRLDRDVLQLFADGFARAYERAALLGRIARQREQVRATLLPDEGWGGSDPGVVRLSRASTTAACEPVAVLASASEVAQGGQLTAREHEILRLLATGATNLAIAEQLFLSESTVKSHVKRILRKLPAANRAEAVYVYLQTVGAQDRSA